MMKLAELALSDAAEEPEGEAEEADGAGMFEDAAMEAFELYQKGDKKAAVAALKWAIESCVADYMADDEE